MKKSFIIFIIVGVGIIVLAGVAIVIAGLTPGYRVQDVLEGVPTVVIESITTGQVATDTNAMPVAIPTLSFDAATYEDKSAGIDFSYPADWSVEHNQQIGDRGSQAALLSPGSTLDQTADGGTRIILTTYKWDPKNDLEAFTAQRKLAWESSGFTVLREGLFTLEDGRQLKIFNVITGKGAEVIFAFMISGENYLQIAGDGKLDLITEIIKSIHSIY